MAISYMRVLRLPERVTALSGSGWLVVGSGYREGHTDSSPLPL